MSLALLTLLTERHGALLSRNCTTISASILGNELSRWRIGMSFLVMPFGKL